MSSRRVVIAHPKIFGRIVFRTRAFSPVTKVDIESEVKIDTVKPLRI